MGLQSSVNEPLVIGPRRLLKELQTSSLEEISDFLFIITGHDSAVRAHRSTKTPGHTGARQRRMKTSLLPTDIRKEYAIQECGRNCVLYETDGPVQR